MSRFSKEASSLAIAAEHRFRSLGTMLRPLSPAKTKSRFLDRIEDLLTEFGCRHQTIVRGASEIALSKDDVTTIEFSIALKDKNGEVSSLDFALPIRDVTNLLKKATPRGSCDVSNLTSDEIIYWLGTWNALGEAGGLGDTSWQKYASLLPEAALGLALHPETAGDLPIVLAEKIAEKTKR